MAKETKTKVLTIKHQDSLHAQEITEAEFNDLQPRIKEKYKITSTKEITTPSEVASA